MRIGPCGLFFSGEPEGLVASVGVVPYSLRVWRLSDFTQVAQFNMTENDTGMMQQQSMGFLAKNLMLVALVSGKDRPSLHLLDPTKRSRRSLSFDQEWSPSKATNFPSAKMLLSADGSLLALASQSERLIRMFQMAPFKSLWHVSFELGEPTSVSISADNRIIAVGTKSGQILLLDANTGDELHPPLHHGTQQIDAVVFSPEGLLVSGGSDSIVKLWNLGDFSSEELARVHQRHIRSASFSHDGRLLATAAGVSFSAHNIQPDDGELCLWDVASRPLLVKLHPHYGSVTSAVFSPDGKSLATTGRDGKMHLWDVEELLRYGVHGGASEDSTSGGSELPGED
jgi:WD40 repeat protein